jgi:hypothetical protein
VEAKEERREGRERRGGRERERGERKRDSLVCTGDLAGTQFCWSTEPHPGEGVGNRASGAQGNPFTSNRRNALCKALHRLIVLEERQKLVSYQ